MTDTVNFTRLKLFVSIFCKIVTRSQGAKLSDTHTVNTPMWITNDFLKEHSILDNSMASLH
jgi:hypothetical protein